jgi:hypothetical protein
MRATRLAAVLSTAALALLLPSAASATVYHATDTTFDSIVAGASGGDTIYVADGDYDPFRGVAETSDLTFKPEPGDNPWFALNLDWNASHLVFDGFQDLDGWNIYGSDHITVKNSRMTGAMAVSNSASDITFDNDTFDDLGQMTGEGRLSILGYSTGITIKNSHFGGNDGCSDGIQLGGGSSDILVQANEFEGIEQGDCEDINGAHTDPIQLYGTSDVTIDGNWFHDNSTGIMSPDANGSPFTATNNVMDAGTDGYDFAIEDGGGENDVIRHNTLIGWTIRVDWSNAHDQPDNETIKDNVLDGDAYVSPNVTGSVLVDYNLVPGGSAGAHSINGSPTFVGGSGPCAYKLRTTSAGHNAASDGRDMGIDTCFSTVDTTPPDTTITSGPANPTSSTSASFAFTSSESGSTFECRIDSGSWSTCTSPKSYSSLATGSHTFDVRATDAASNTDATPASQTWTIRTITAPTFVGEHEVSSWTTTTGTVKSTSSFSVTAGDLLVAYGGTADGPVTEAISSSGVSLTWTLRQSNVALGLAPSYVWTATAPSSGSVTVRFTRTGSYGSYGGDVLQFRNSAGVGASAITTGSGTPSLGITTTTDHSALVVYSSDWRAVNGSSRTWLTSSAGTFSEQTYFTASGDMTGYGGYHADAGTAGSKTVGLSAPSGQDYTTIALEVKGS